jgi:hypothetical protein
MGLVNDERIAIGRFASHEFCALGHEGSFLFCLSR